MSDVKATPAILPSKIHSVKMDDFGRPASSLPYDGREPADRGQRDEFPRASLPAKDLEQQLKDAANGDFEFTGDPITPGAQELRAPAFPQVEGLIDGGTAKESPKAGKRPVVRFLKEAKTGKPYELEEPFEYGGTEYRTVVLQSPTGVMWDEYTEIAAEHAASMSVVIIWLVSRIPVPAIFEMSLDDKEGILEEGFPFLPRRLRKRMEAAIEAGSKMTESSNTKP